MKNIFLFFFFVMQMGNSFSQEKEVSITIEKEEKWWLGVINHGELMPFSNSSEYTINLLGHNKGNQVQPLLLSNKGRYIWSEDPFTCQFKEGILKIMGSGKIESGKSGSTLSECQKFVRERYFPSTGSMPDLLLFKSPQYNTWIELNYNQNQSDVLNYARNIIKKGFSPGVLMIDATWEERVGTLNFHPGLFPNPKAMMAELHKLGFKVMLWVCPFVSADSKQYRELFKLNALMKDSIRKGESLIVKWWDGYSAQLDFSNPVAVKWFREKLNYLQKEFKVDGFKFDAGDFNFYPAHAITNQKINANEQSKLFAEIGVNYPLNEFRACWKMGGRAIAQRLRDKEHTWEDLRKLIPHGVLAGLSGYAFICPDMIGGGEIESFSGPNPLIDQELFVRSAQCQVLMPMMQFSAAPWRVLDNTHFSAVKSMLELRKKFTPLIVLLAKQSAISGEPIMKSVEYVYPNQGFSDLTDQFFLGDSLMIAPMVQKNMKSRTVRLPKLKNGKWRDDKGIIYSGGNTIQIEVPLSRLPYFQLIN